MSFNLINESWLPLRRESGRQEYLRPGDLTTKFETDPVVALDFPRPDWNAAITEWLIGLAFLTLRPNGVDEWTAAFREPPTPDSLLAAFANLTFAFDLDGDGPRAFQDFDSLGNAEIKPLSGLLIDAPGENTLKNNADLFNKRGGAGALSLPFVAAALITLQTYAPSGGAGHRTSMRGGGPLTTLVAPRRRTGDGDRQTLWDKIWANTPDKTFDRWAMPAAGSPGDEAWKSVFPWLGATNESNNGQIVSPEDVATSQAFFACPRRIRLVFGETSQTCQFGGGHGPVAIGLRTLNYGANYEGWTHPLSPYRADKSGLKLPLHPQSGASDYGDYAAWGGVEGEAALCLRDWQSRRLLVRPLLGAQRVEAFGFDMDNMKARQWLQAQMPWLPVHGPHGEALRLLLRDMVKASDEAARALRYAVKIAIYGQRQPAGGYMLPDNLPKDALPEAGDQLWRATETRFRAEVRRLSDAFDGDLEPASVETRERWLAVLRRETPKLFDASVDVDGLTVADPRRLLIAKDKLVWVVSSRGPVAKALQIGPSAASPTPKEAA